MADSNLRALHPQSADKLRVEGKRRKLRFAADEVIGVEFRRVSPMAIVKVPTPDRVEKVFEPYAREVGKLVASWNQLQERLGELFSTVVRKDHPAIALAIWHASQSDRAQRQMLRAATETAAAAGLLAHRAKAVDDIKWLLDRSNELADQRNDAIHAPVALFTDQDGTKLMAEYFFGNPRASKLKDKVLSDEFSWYEKKATVLAGFALGCAFCLRNDAAEWVQRPLLPTRQGDPQA